MTALKKYQRLECPGLWREGRGAQRRDVIVSFREASLILSDPKTDMPLSHWSLPAVERVNGADMPALFSPGPDSTETLEIDDTVMIEALETVRAAVTRGTPRPGRLRLGIVAATVVTVLAGGIFWLPGALVTHTASVLPTATRLAIGKAALADLGRLTGAACDDPLGMIAVETLSKRLFTGAARQILVVKDGVPGAVHLPGGIILLNDDLLTGNDQPGAVAGYILAEALRAETTDPMLALLRHAGLTATLRLLTTGTLPEGAVAGYGERLLAAPPAPLDEPTLLARFRAAEVPSTAYGYAVDRTGETTLPLIEADPWRNGPPRPVMSDEDWVALQGICTR